MSGGHPHFHLNDLHVFVGVETLAGFRGRCSG